MQYLLIDAFTLPGRPFSGNPAAVVLLDPQKPWPNDSWLADLAMEFNQSETAYLRRRPDLGHNTYDLRWFTPAVEVPLCGHATLASAHALRAWNAIDPAKPVTFVTRKSGDLTCTYPRSDQISMDFPAVPTAPAALPPDAANVLGVEGPVTGIGAGGTGLLLRLPNATQVLAAKPDFKKLATWHPHAVFITAPGDDSTGNWQLTTGNSPPPDFVSRFFAPAAGIDEDPVTGSAHCTLALYWAKELGKTYFTAVQLSKRRGLLSVTLSGNRVQLQGRANITARGAIESSPPD
jgi:PhzF family phenazine biosynthesis protein